MTTMVKQRDPFQLEAVTDAGSRLASLAEAHAADFACRAAQHDRDASFPHENIAALQQSGVLAAAVPEELGGMGVGSVQDLAVCINRIARGDASTALVANMHLVITWVLSAEWQTAVAAGASEQAAPLEELLRGVAAGQVFIYIAMTEPGTDILHPLVTGTRVDGGWSLNGRKIFGTGSAAAQLAFVSFRGLNEAGEERTYGALVPLGTPGMEIVNSWDALGMRATQSDDTVFRNCVVPEDGAIDVAPWGEWSQLDLVGNIAGNLGLAAAFLGIAETARDLAIELVTTRRKAPGNRLLAERGPIQHTVAENEVDLAACRAMLERTARIADAAFAEQADPNASLDPLHTLMKDFQCTKWLVTRRAVEIVDRAMTLSGGSGYLNGSPLARLYRDVRAGMFMQPFSPNEAFEYIGKVTLGLDPTLEG